MTKQNILIRHGPLPWFGNLRIEVSDIKQLYCEKYYGVLTMGSFRYVFRPKHATILYRVSAVLNNYQKIKLVTGIDSYDVAIFLENEIEAWLEIEDRVVADEL